MDWQDKQKLDKLAEIKAQIQDLDAQAKEIQTDLVERYGDTLPKKYSTTDGTMTLTTRSNWSKPENEHVIKVINQDMFNRFATISITNIKKAGGEAAVSELVKAGHLREGEPTIYYSFKKDKD